MRVESEVLAKALRANLRRRKGLARGGSVRGETPRNAERRFVIEGGRALEGEIDISGAKNAALPLMIAGLLSDAPLVLTNIPQLTDILLLRRILGSLGVAVSARGERGLCIEGSGLAHHIAPEAEVSQMRAGFWVLGPLLARLGKARVPLPGGDAIGARPVDIHLDGLRRLGAEVHLADGMIEASIKGKLRGAEITLPFPSVGATHHLILAAVLAEGETLLRDAAIEPEILALAACLQRMGAKITHQGRAFRIEGVAKLNSAEFAVPPDRIEAGTYAIAAAITGGRLVLRDAPVEEMQAVLGMMREAGIKWHSDRDASGLMIDAREKIWRAVSCKTEVFPGFPTDLQAQWMGLMALAEGVSEITEQIFENRFRHIAELKHFGADIMLEGQCAKIHGVTHLRGAKVEARDLRASASLVLAALAAEGRSEIAGIDHLERGFERMEEKLAACGASIRLVGGLSSIMEE